MSEPVDYTDALLTVNDLKDSVSGMVRAITNAVKSGGISTSEKIILGMKGLALASSMTALIQEGTDADRAMVLYVLEHGHITMDGV